MTSHLPNDDYHVERARHPPAGQHNELRAMLAGIKVDFRDELHNVSLAEAWPLIERTALALLDADARRRDTAADAMLDGIMQILGDTHRRLRACDEFEDSEG